MKRSEINALIRSAQLCFTAHEWNFPPRPRWDVTDFGLADWQNFGLVLVNLAEEPLKVSAPVGGVSTLTRGI